MIKEYGYEYDAVLNRELWADTQGKVSHEKLWGAHCLRSGRDALKAIAREYESATVLLPALSCDSMISPFEYYKHKVSFYKLNSDYSINFNEFQKLINHNNHKDCLFLYMDYFGCKALSDENLVYLKDHYKNLIFIEDRTHNLIWERNSTFRPDYIIASLRKWIAVPDGGLLWGNITKPLCADTLFTSRRLKAQQMRHEFLENGNFELKTQFRKIFSTVSEIMDSDEPSAISAYSYALARETDWDQVRLQRKKNADVLESILAPYVSLIRGPFQSALYVPFIVSDREGVQAVLSAKGIFNTVIWPLSTKQKSICKVAEFTTENMLAAPCDQRYCEKDMEYIGKEIVKVIQNRCQH